VSRAFEVSYAALWVSVLGIAFIMFALLRQVGILLQRLGPVGAMSDERLSPGANLPEIGVASLDLGSSRELRPVGSDALAILFVTTTCALCAEVAPAFDAILRRQRTMDGIVAVSAPRGEARLWAGAHRTRTPAYSREMLLEDAGVPMSPFVAVVDGDGTVRAAGLVNNGEQIESVLTAARSYTGGPAASEPALAQVRVWNSPSDTLVGVADNHSVEESTHDRA
jgi:methylamine dehydrogenase accessory protein MauD